VKQPGEGREDRRDQEASSGRALVVHPDSGRGAAKGRSAAGRLEEALGLTRAINLEVVDGRIVKVVKARPSTLLGKGAVEALGEVARAEEVTVAVIDAQLTPIQQRNLERAWDCKVIDRTGLILEIFGARARTKEGKLQVELAALTYQRSRLVRSWTHLERQRGGFGFLGGPGESQLEIDRRLISRRIARIETDLERVKRTRELHRKARRRVPYPVVSLVGYTNAGKSTLFNRLAGTKVFAEDLLFATLDPTMRRVALDGGQEIILSDTVGFISALPTGLVAAFRATLEEVTAADLILHVRDVSHPDSAAQRDDVLVVLDEMGLNGALEHRLFEVLNKIDQLDEESRAMVLAQAARRENAVAISALTGEGLDVLLAAIGRRLASGDQAVSVTIPLSDGAAIAWLYDRGRVVRREDTEGTAHLLVHLDPADRSRFERRHGAGAIEQP
jgi:GTP-binding protein HflX